MNQIFINFALIGFTCFFWFHVLLCCGKYLLSYFAPSTQPVTRNADRPKYSETTHSPNEVNTIKKRSKRMLSRASAQVFPFIRFRSRKLITSKWTSVILMTRFIGFVTILNYHRRPVVPPVLKWILDKTNSQRFIEVTKTSFLPPIMSICLFLNIQAYHLYQLGRRMPIKDLLGFGTQHSG